MRGGRAVHAEAAEALEEEDLFSDFGRLRSVRRRGVREGSFLIAKACPHRPSQTARRLASLLRQAQAYPTRGRSSGRCGMVVLKGKGKGIKRERRGSAAPVRLPGATGTSDVERRSACRCACR